MGKSLIIKGANFSANAITASAASKNYYIPQTVINAVASSFFVQSNATLTDDVNELSGKTITGFDLLFINKCSGQTMGEKITFNPGTKQEIVCNINCTFETQDESEQKTIHYNLLEPYTFKENDVLCITPTGATYADSSSRRGGCSVFRVNRPNNTPNFAFLVKLDGKDTLAQYSYQPFAKLYLQ